MGPGAGHITRPIAPNRGQGFRNGNGVFIGFGGGGYWWPGLYGYDGYYGGIGGAPYYGDGYQSFYPPGDVFGTPMPGAVLPGSETAPTPRVATALVLVIVPTEDAELWFNGAKTQTRGQKREFLTPELPPGQIFTYEVKVRWTENGKENERTRTVRVQAGSQSGVNFQVEDREQLPLPIQVAPPPIKM